MLLRRNNLWVRSEIIETVAYGSSVSGAPPHAAARCKMIELHCTGLRIARACLMFMSTS
jgi:hypothetical protein